VARAGPDFYAILGVPKNASPEALREAYTRLAKKYHPDLNPDRPQNGELFKSVTEAYAVLRDDKTRARYDRLRNKLKSGPLKAKKPPAQASSPKPWPNHFKDQRGEAAKNSEGAERPKNAGNEPPPFSDPRTASQRTANQKTASQRTTNQKTANQRTTSQNTASQNTASQKTEGFAQAFQTAAPFAEKPKTEPSPKEGREGAPKPDATHGPKAAPKAFAFAQKKAGPEPTRPPENNLFSRLLKSKRGQASLGKIQEEPSQKGLGVSVERLSREFSGEKKSVWAKAKDALKNIMGDSDAKGESPYDIAYKLAISPKAAATGTTVSINYLRDQNQTQRLEIHIPPGTKDQSRLRLLGQGHLGPNQKRGDLVLTLMVLAK
jgi:DnaJ-class molecular chaperone